MAAIERAAPNRLFKKDIRQGRSKRGGESYSVPYVEPLSDARTLAAAFFNSLLEEMSVCVHG